MGIIARRRPKQRFRRISTSHLQNEPDRLKVQLFERKRERTQIIHQKIPQQKLSPLSRTCRRQSKRLGFGRSSDQKERTGSHES